MAYFIKLSIMVVQFMVTITSTLPTDPCPEAPSCIQVAMISEPVCWNFQAQCINNRCLCTKKGYNPCTCRPYINHKFGFLAEVGGCKVQEAGYDGSAANAFMGLRRLKTNSCIRQTNPSQRQVHVISMHRGVEHGDVGEVPVDVFSTNFEEDTQEVVLVLASYKAVRWILNLKSPVHIDLLVIIESGLYGQPDPSINIRSTGSTIGNWEKLTSSESGWGFGNDSGGVGDTPTLLRFLENRYGVVQSFSGAMKVDRWNISLDYSPDSNENLPTTARVDSTTDQQTTTGYSTTSQSTTGYSTTSQSTTGYSTTSQSTTEYITTGQPMSAYIETTTDKVEDTTSSGLHETTIPNHGTTTTYAEPTDESSSSLFCPVYMCDKNCSFGYQVDELGCELCECNPEVTCPPIKCRIHCEYGYQKGHDGCDRCICIIPTGIENTTSVQINDTDYGFRSSEFCPVYICDKTCDMGFQEDEYGCEICECVIQPVTCPSVNCRIHCEYGYQKGQDGCERCICVTPPPCRSLDLCPIGSCKNGFQEDDNGCLMCACAALHVTETRPNQTTLKSMMSSDNKATTTSENETTIETETQLDDEITTTESQLMVERPPDDGQQQPKYQSYIPAFSIEPAP
ncbi:uncharacterized protein [Antedon mediterranea]|uniref:uncharacterized protein n=1 Tax=Antedon mediterranea TaxID=105859 RepID=UPI003AF41FFC